MAKSEKDVKVSLFYLIKTMQRRVEGLKEQKIDSPENLEVIKELESWIKVLTHNMKLMTTGSYFRTKLKDNSFVGGYFDYDGNVYHDIELIDYMMEREIDEAKNGRQDII